MMPCAHPTGLDDSGHIPCSLRCRKPAQGAQPHAKLKWPTSTTDVWHILAFFAVAGVSEGSRARTCQGKDRKRRAGQHNQAAAPRTPRPGSSQSFADLCSFSGCFGSGSVRGHTRIGERGPQRTSLQCRQCRQLNDGKRPHHHQRRTVQTAARAGLVGLTGRVAK